MPFIVQRYSNSTTSYSGSQYQNLTGGTSKLKIYAGATTSTYPLTTNTSASQYCKFKIKVGNHTAFLAQSISTSISRTTTTWKNSISRSSGYTTTSTNKSGNSTTLSSSQIRYSTHNTTVSTTFTAGASGSRITQSQSINNEIHYWEYCKISFGHMSGEWGNAHVGGGTYEHSITIDGERFKLKTGYNSSVSIATSVIKTASFLISTNKGSVQYSSTKNITGIMSTAGQTISYSSKQSTVASSTGVKVKITESWIGGTFKGYFSGVSQIATTTNSTWKVSLTRSSGYTTTSTTTAGTTKASGTITSGTTSSSSHNINI